MPKTNDEIMREYKARFLGIATPMFKAPLNGQAVESSVADLNLMMETIYIVDSFKADPSASLLQAKLAYNLDDYKGKWAPAELVGKITDTMLFFSRWKPGALFV